MRQPKPVPIMRVEFLMPLAAKGLITRCDTFLPAVYQLEGFVIRRRNSIVVVTNFHVDPWDEEVEYVIIPRVCVRRMWQLIGG